MPIKFLLVVKYSKWPEYVHNIQCPPKYTQIGIFGLKRNHLATLPGSKNVISWTFKIPKLVIITSTPGLSKSRPKLRRKWNIFCVLHKRCT
jgi:hypothetical protein